MPHEVTPDTTLLAPIMQFNGPPLSPLQEPLTLAASNGQICPGPTLAPETGAILWLHSACEMMPIVAFCRMLGRTLLAEVRPHPDITQFSPACWLSLLGGRGAYPIHPVKKNRSSESNCSNIVGECYGTIVVTLVLGVSSAVRVDCSGVVGSIM